MKTIKAIYCVHNTNCELFTQQLHEAVANVQKTEQEVEIQYQLTSVPGGICMGAVIIGRVDKE